MDQDVIDAAKLRLFDLSLDLLMVANRDGKIITVSPSVKHILGFDVEDMSGKTFLEFVHPDDKAATQAVAADMIRTGKKTVNFENRYRTKNGKYRWIRWKGNVDMERGWLLGIGTDVTEEKKFKEKQEEQKKELKEITHLLTGREERMIELKEEIARLKKKCGEKKEK